MIETLTDLQKYTHRLASLFPQLSEELEIKAIGVSLEEVNGRSTDINLPPVYKACAEKLGLFGVSIGYFALWPGFVRKGYLVEAITSANSGDRAWGSVAKAENLIAVARQEGNMICVGALGTRRRDTVYLLEIMTTPSVRLLEVAPDFEAFLLLAANLHSISDEYEEKVDAGIQEMKRCAMHFHCSEAQKEFWVSRAHEMLS